MLVSCVTFIYATFVKTAILCLSKTSDGLIRTEGPMERQEQGIGRADRQLSVNRKNKEKSSSGASHPATQPSTE